MRFSACNDAGKACGSATGAGGRKSSHCWESVLFINISSIDIFFLHRDCYRVWITMIFTFKINDLWLVTRAQESSGLQLSWGFHDEFPSRRSFRSSFFRGFVATLLKEVQQVPCVPCVRDHGVVDDLHIRGWVFLWVLLFIVLSHGFTSNSHRYVHHA